MDAHAILPRASLLLAALFCGHSAGCTSPDTHASSNAAGSGGSGATTGSSAGSGGSPDASPGDGAPDGPGGGGSGGGSGLPGPLTQSMNPNYFQDSTGRALLLAGSHT